MNLGFYTSNFEKLFEVMKQYDADRKRLQADLYAKADKLEKYKDSASYADEIKGLLKQYDDALKPLTDSTIHYIQYIEKLLVDQVNAMKSEPITPEQLDLLKLAQMRETPTADELDNLAESVKSNPTALQVVAEMAKRAGISKDYRSLNNTVTRSEALAMVKNVMSTAADYVRCDVRKAVRMTNDFKLNHYGGSDQMANALTQRELAKTDINFTNQDAFYSSAFGMSPDECGRFRSALGDE